MNYLAHLFLAQPNTDSYFGNLLGDFGGNTHVTQLAAGVKKGLENHYLVDKYTDNHPLVKQGKLLFSSHRRRFSGIALDVLFDHFLIRHWDLFHPVPFIEFKKNSYLLLRQNIPNMPKRMAVVVSRITQDDWFQAYESREGIGMALDNIAKRIRFRNQFSNSIEDINLHYHELETLFLAFFPDLVHHVKIRNLENIK